MERLIMLQECVSGYVKISVAHAQYDVNEDQKSLKDAIHELRSLLRLLKQQESPGIPPYVTYWRFGLHECKIGDLSLPADTAITKDLFSKVYKLLQ